MLHRSQGLPRRSMGLFDCVVRRTPSNPLLPQGEARTAARGTGRRVMASVVMADHGIVFDGQMAETAPLGGAETAFVALAEALAARGHRVEARTWRGAALVHKGVSWA